MKKQRNTKNASIRHDDPSNEANGSSMNQHQRKTPFFKNTHLNPVSPHVPHPYYVGFGKRHKKRFQVRRLKTTRGGWVKSHGLMKHCMPRLLSILEQSLAIVTETAASSDSNSNNNNNCSESIRHHWTLAYKVCATLLRAWRLYPETTCEASATCLKHIMKQQQQEHGHGHAQEEDEDIHDMQDDGDEEEAMSDLAQHQFILRFYRKFQNYASFDIGFLHNRWFQVDILHTMALHHASADNIKAAYEQIDFRHSEGNPYNKDFRLLTLFGKHTMQVLVPLCTLTQYCYTVVTSHMNFKTQFKSLMKVKEQLNRYRYE
jgi:hypothetical protein